MKKLAIQILKLIYDDITLKNVKNKRFLIAFFFIGLFAIMIYDYLCGDSIFNH